MANLNLPWLVGQHLTSIVITPLVQSGTVPGVYVTGTPVVTLTAKITNLSNDLTIESEEINAMNSVRTNTVSLAFGYPLSFEYLKSTNADPNPILSALGSGVDNYMQAAWTEGVSPFAQTFVVWGRFGGLQEPREGRGAKKVTFTLDPADFGTATFSRTIG